MDLLKINYDNERITLSARELHVFLGIGTEFRKWFPRMAEYGFTEKQDYRRVSQKCPTPGGIQKISDYEITLDMAKEISMLQRSEKGKQARQYFIELEKKWNSPEFIISRALEISKRRCEDLMLETNALKQINNELKPKADYYDDILQNKGLVTITAIAKDYGMSASKFNAKLHELGVQYKQSGQWFLYHQYQDKGYTHSQTITINVKGKERIKMSTKWTQKGRFFLYELLKTHNIIPIIEMQ